MTDMANSISFTGKHKSAGDHFLGRMLLTTDRFIGERVTHMAAGRSRTLLSSLDRVVVI
jgi:hypothetical protein